MMLIFIHVAVDVFVFHTLRASKMMMTIMLIEIDIDNSTVTS